MNRLETLFESPGLQGGDMPKQLQELYGGRLALPDATVYGNFVTSIDGVAAIKSELRSSLGISGGNPGDRLIMGLLRAWADVVLVGAGTLRAHPGGLWTPAQAYPLATESFRRLREQAGLTIAPQFAVLSGSGRLDTREPSLKSATVITTQLGRTRLEGALPKTATIVAAGDETFGPAAAIDILRSQGHGRILTEGGPTVMAGLIKEKVLNELFLTISPVLAGRNGGSTRPGFINGIAFEPHDFIGAILMSVRLYGSHLFLRYELPSSDYKDCRAPLAAGVNKLG
jgi:riboflavin biosynthesis pyrimidine reductase